MKIEIREITPEGNDFHFSESAEEMDISVTGVKFPMPIEVDLSIVLSGDELICQGEVHTDVEVECSRCLEIFDLPVRERLQFVVQMTDSPIMNSDEDNDEFEMIPKTQTFIDISDRVRDSIVLQISMKPLCSEDCKGLCPMCGINLNEEECNCMPDKTDERWETLKNLYDDQFE
ncbi:MAG: DUF177 domain-containing protein [candidate division Zixibacteria bacterium]|nr:DUF177 domain-containing protein [candidate division Zixibacteria bacterium]